MPLARYFFFVGAALLALLFVADAYLPKLPAAERTNVTAGLSVIRIHSDRKWPEPVVFDTNLASVAPPTTGGWRRKPRRRRALPMSPRRCGCGRSLRNCRDRRPIRLSSSRPISGSRSRSSTRNARPWQGAAQALRSCWLRSNRALAFSATIFGEPAHFRAVRNPVMGISPRILGRRGRCP